MAAAATTVGDRSRRAVRRSSLAWVGTLPFLCYLGIFLLLPTGIVIWGAVSKPTGHGLTLSNLKLLGGSAARGFFLNSVELSAITAIVGALLGAALAYAVASGNPSGVVRRVFLAGSGVLAQFGGVTLAFAFNAAIGPSGGFLTHASWYYDFPQGIGLIYIYFQIPLMVLVFLPAVDGLKVQWREATENLGGSTLRYWRHVGGPLLAPAFLGCTLLLFANALSAYATIVAWENQISYVVTQQISVAMTSEVGLSSANEAQVLALGMVVVVALVMTAYALFFVLPIYAMVRFSLQGVKPGEYSLKAWRQIASSPDLVGAIEITLELAIITCVVVLLLLVPTMIWVRLRVQWISRTVEFLCLLPLTIPAIVLVVGLAPVYRTIRQHAGLSALQLFWAYAILALPYAYRALAAGLDAIDVKTLSEAARSLGANWLTVMWRVIAPNMRQALLNATLLTGALVLGEFTIASLLLYANLQVELYNISRATLNAW